MEAEDDGQHGRGQDRGARTAHGGGRGAGRDRRARRRPLPCSGRPAAGAARLRASASPRLRRRARALPAAPPAARAWRSRTRSAASVLAWVGGAAVALGVIFLLAIAVSRGWLGEVERTAARRHGLVRPAGRGHLGARPPRSNGRREGGRRGRDRRPVRHLRRGHRDVRRSSRSPLALAVAVAVGAIATSLAVRWAAPGIAALGVLGALASPVLVGAVGADAPVAVPSRRDRVRGRRPAVAALDLAGARRRS